MRPVTRPTPLEKVTVRLTSTEAAQLRELASMYGVSLTEMARRVTLWGYTLYARYPLQRGAVIVPDGPGLALHVKARGERDARVIEALLSVYEREINMNETTKTLIRSYDPAAHIQELYERAVRLSEENGALRAELAAAKKASQP